MLWRRRSRPLGDSANIVKYLRRPPSVPRFEASELPISHVLQTDSFVRGVGADCQSDAQDQWIKLMMPAC